MADEGWALTGKVQDITRVGTSAIEAVELVGFAGGNARDEVERFKRWGQVKGAMVKGYKGEKGDRELLHSRMPVPASRLNAL